MTVAAVPVVFVPRHTGRVYVRGRIRRIWRPRYMELIEDGTLRYYYEEDTKITESMTGISTAGTSSTTTTHPPRHHQHPHPQQQHHNYKYTLVVTGARILDVTTIRDLHT